MSDIDVVMLSDAEIARIVMSEPDAVEFAHDIAETVLENAASLAASRFVDSTGAYVASLTARVDEQDGELLATVEASVPEALWIEYGTVNRTTQAGANRGAMPAMHILSDAVQSAGLPLGSSSD